jgi:glutamate N-acetyltransferase / amino-acid N-acetyltransferase
MTYGNIPSGFRFSGTNCGLKKKENDLGLFYSSSPCSAAGVFTRNLAKAAPILVSREHLRHGKIQAIIANSKCANACTGAKGLLDAGAMCALTARRLGLDKRQVLVASTGVIGKYLDMEKVTGGINTLCEKTVRLGARPEPPVNAVRAIMTTDTFPKTAYAAVVLGGRKIKIWACAKGAGMIHPDMATFLCFIFTDCAISGAMLGKALRLCADKTFNLLSVDGVTSTNDTVFALANGAARNPAIKTAGGNFGRFRDALEKVCARLARQVATDGEGATKFVLLRVTRARSTEDAKKIARKIAGSPLVKTAIFGADANWGRVITSVGSAGVKLDMSRVSIYFGGMCVCRNGRHVAFSEPAAKKILQKPELKLTVDLNCGKRSLDYYTCDMGYDYIKINADYRT